MALRSDNINQTRRDNNHPFGLFASKARRTAGRARAAWRKESSSPAKSPAKGTTQLAIDGDSNLAGRSSSWLHLRPRGKTPTTPYGRACATGLRQGAASSSPPPGQAEALPHGGQPNPQGVLPSASKAAKSVGHLVDPRNRPIHMQPF